jgi:hypothetical protein
MITITSFVKAKQGLIETSLVDELVMLDIESGHYFSLKGSASFIWAQIQKPIQVSDILAIIVQEYDVTFENARSEVLEFLNRLNSKGLVHKL